MTAIKLTAAQYRALDLTAGVTARRGPAPARPRARRGGDARAEPVPYHTVCHDCGEHFTTRAGETRHLNATRHARYELVLQFEEIQ